MDIPLVACSSCHTPLPDDALNAGGPVVCSFCRTQVTAEVFPALLKGTEGGQGGEILVEASDAGCFSHPGRKAVSVCERCGRFMCSLCEIELGEETICPVCLETGWEKGSLKNIKKEGILHDNVALGLALYPLIFFPLTIFTAPVSIYLSFRNWRKKTSIMPRTRIRYILAILISGLQVTGWIYVFVF